MSVLPFASTPRNAVIGIDPGVKGALSFIDTVDWTLGVVDMPTITVTRSGETFQEPAPAVLAEIIREVQPLLVASEKLTVFGMHPNPYDLMKMGRWRGQIEGIVAMAECGFEHAYPADWKRTMGLTSDKEVSRSRANALFKGCEKLWARKKDHDRAEAALIALYGCLTLGLRPRPFRPMAPGANDNTAPRKMAA